MVLLLFKILRLEQKIVNQLSRRITNSLFSLECFINKIFFSFKPATNIYQYCKLLNRLIYHVVDLRRVSDFLFY